MEYRVEFNQELLDEYLVEYFRRHPKATKKPITRPLHPSINEWMGMQRHQLNALKQHWKDFSVFVCFKHGVTKLNIEKCSMEMICTHPTKVKRDNDNLACKFILDGFTAAQFLSEDNYFVLNPLIIRSRYEKGVTKMEFIIRTEDGACNDM